MLTLRTFGTDENPVGASPFVSVPVPVGVFDGDVVLVGVSSAAGVLVLPPDDTWAELGTTYPAPVGGQCVSVFAKTAASESGRWIFVLGSSSAGAAACVVYGGADLLGAVESVAPAITASAAHSDLAGFTVADDNEDAVAFLASGAVAGGGFGPAAGWLSVAQSQSANGVAAAHRQSFISARVVGSGSASLSAAAPSSSLVVVLRRSVGEVTVDEARERLVRALPPGMERVLDVEEAGGDYRNYYAGAARALKAHGYDLVDVARAETAPETARFLLSEWEGLFGLDHGRVASSGTLPQRRATVVAGWRRHGASTLAAIQAALVPVMGYSPDIIEPSRSAVTTAHGYPWPNLVVADGATYTHAITIPDGPRFGNAGLQVLMSWLALSGSIGPTTVSLNGTVFKSWDLTGYRASGSFRLGGIEYAGLSTAGPWTLEVVNHSGDFLTVVPKLLVDAIGRSPDLMSEGLGAVMYEWSVVYDPARVGSNADIATVRDIVAGMSPAHTRGGVVYVQSDGTLCALCDDNFCVADATVCC